MSNNTKEIFEAKFGDMLLNGLDSKGTYIPLRTSTRYGINVAIRPMVLRVAPGVVLYGGKLRVGYTLDDKHDPVKTKIVDISPQSRFERLKDFCKGFSWQKADERRFSTIIGFGVAATKYDGEIALKHLEENSVAKDFINRLERTYKQYNEVSFGHRRAAAIEALEAAWILQSDDARIFAPLQEFTPLPEAVVGKQTALLNKAQDKYKDNVVSFEQKIKDWAEAAAEDQYDSA